jgi:hypothetical protein
MVGTLCISGACLVKAGANVSTYFSTGATAEARIGPLINQAECYINALTKYNWIDAYSGLDADRKLLLELLASNLTAIYMIQYDMSSYSSRSEAETMIDVLYSMLQQGLKRLEEEKIRDFVTGA